MTKSELIEKVAEQTGMTKKATGEAVNAVLDAITYELGLGGEVNLTGFGKFYVADVAARQGRNPQTGEAVEIEAHKSPKFKFSGAVKDAVR